MKIISEKEYTRLSNGKLKVIARIAADELPTGFPDSDTAIQEAFPGHVFDTGSVLQILDSNVETKVYIVNEAGNWIAAEGSVSYLF